MNRKIKYHIYPKTIEIGRYYWYRRLDNHTITLVNVVVDLKNEEYVVEIDNQYSKTVQRKELLIFNPYSRLFKTLMRLPMYRTDPQIKKALTKMDLKPELFQVVEKEPLDTLDSDLGMEEFYNEYDRYLRSDVLYWDDPLNYPRKLVVTGTNKLDLYELYKIVSLNGGMERITNEQRWKSLFYAIMSKTNVSYTIRTFYKKHLYEFEFLRRQKEDEYDYCYKFKIKQNVYLYADQNVYYGTIKLRRNRGLNQYYLQFVGWSKEYCEWYCEDVLFLYDKKLTHENIMKRRTRSSKANNLIDDPLTREKHCHLGAKMRKNDDENLHNKVDIEFIDQKKIDEEKKSVRTNCVEPKNDENANKKQIKYEMDDIERKNENTYTEYSTPYNSNDIKRKHENEKTGYSRPYNSNDSKHNYKNKNSDSKQNYDNDDARCNQENENSEHKQNYDNDDARCNQENENTEYKQNYDVDDARYNYEKENSEYTIIYDVDDARYYQENENTGYITTYDVDDARYGYENENTDYTTNYDTDDARCNYENTSYNTSYNDSIFDYEKPNYETKLASLQSMINKKYTQKSYQNKPNKSNKFNLAKNDVYNYKHKKDSYHKKENKYETKKASFDNILQNESTKFYLEPFNVSKNVSKTLIDSKKRKKSVIAKDMFEKYEIRKITKKRNKKNDLQQKQDIKKILVNNEVVNEYMDINEWNDPFLRFFNLK